MEQIILTSPEISCDHCKATIEREIGGMAGVDTVAVDVSTRRIDVTFDEAIVSEADIVARLDEEGYPTGA